MALKIKNERRVDETKVFPASLGSRSSLVQYYAFYIGPTNVLIWC